MEIKDSGELIYYTYYMVDWERVKQIQSREECVKCGKNMFLVEDVRDQKGREYEGHVCHHCKAVFWIKKD